MKKKRNSASLKSRIFILIVLAVVISICTVGATFSYVKDQTGAITNIFGAANVFQLNYDLNGGTGEITSQVYIGSSTETSCDFTVTPEEPTDASGRIFLGWADSADASEAAYHADETITLTLETLSKTLYAVWQVPEADPHDFALEFHANVPENVTGASVSVPAAKSVTVKAETYTFHVDNAVAFDYNVKKTGLRFLGWATGEFGNVIYTPTNDEKQSISVPMAPGTIHLYAVWGYDYYVTFERNVSDGSVVKHTSADSYVDDGKPITVITDYPTISVYGAYAGSGYSYNRADHMLVGFSQQESGGVIDTLTISKPGEANTLHLYAIWQTGTFGLIYDANGGKTAPEATIRNTIEDTCSITVTSDVPVSYDSTEARFLGWSTDRNATEPDPQYEAGKTVTLDKEHPSLVLYAVWEYTYRLSFAYGHANEGEIPEPIEAVSRDKSYTFTIPSEPTPKRDGDTYFFDYWAASEDRVSGETRYYDAANYYRTITLHADDTAVTLYARMAPTAGVTLSYNANGGSGAPGAATDNKNTQDFCAFTVPSTQPTRSNYTFLGWAESSSAVTPQYQAGDVVYIDGDVTPTKTLYAVWKRYDRMRVYINFNGGYYTKDRTEGCNTYTDYYYDRTGSWEYLTPGATYHAFDIVEFEKKGLSDLYFPSRTGYTVAGFAYLNEEGRLSTDITISESSLCDTGGVEGFEWRASWQTAGEQSVTENTTNPDGSRDMTLTVYIIWAKNDARDTYKVILDQNHSGGTSYNVSVSESIKQVANSDPDSPEVNTSYTFSSGSFSLSSMASSRYGYQLLGFARTPDATEVQYPVSGTTLSTSITVTADDPDVTFVNGGGVDGGSSYTLRLYAVWARQHVFKLHVDFQSGSYYASSTTYKSRTFTSTQPLDVPSHTFTSALGGTPTRSGYKLLGFSADPASTAPEYSLSSQTLTPNPEVHINGPGVVKETDSDNVDTYTLTLYAIWEKQQIFRLTLDYNDGSYVSGDTELKSSTRSTTLPLSESGKTWTLSSGLSMPTRKGHKLMGYAYTANATEPVFTISGTGLDPADITVSQDGEHVVYSTSDGVDIYTLTLYAVWHEEQIFSVTISANGGSFPSSSTTTFSQTFYVEETSHTWPEATLVFTKPSRTGFAFLGYAYDSQATVPDFTLDENGYVQQPITVDETDSRVVNVTDPPASSTLTLYAVWTPQKIFRYTLNMNGGSYYTSSSSSGIGEYTGISVNYPLDATSHTFSSPSYTTYYANPSRSGFYFVGFGDTPTATEPCVTYSVSGSSQPYTAKLSAIEVTEGAPGVTTEVAENGVTYVTKTLYAIWAIKLQYSNGSNLPETVIRIHPTEADRKFDISPQIPTKNQFAFAGWATSVSSGQPPTPEYGVSGYVSNSTDPLPSTITFSSSTSARTLYAVWWQQYELSYNANGGEESTTGGRDSKYVTLNYNASSTTATWDIANNQPYREGYIFLGWSLDPNATTASYSPGGSIQVSGNADGSKTETVLYAVWQENLDAAEAKNSESYDLAKGPDKSTPDAATPPSEEATLPTEGNTAPTEESTTPTESGTPPAAQEWKYELRYDANGGDTATLPDNETGSSTEDKVAVAVRFRNKAEDPLPAREGYAFLGWAETADATVPQYLEGNSAEILRSEAEISVLTLYAVWEKNADPGTLETTPPTESSKETSPPTEGSNDTPAPANIVDAATPPAPVSTEPTSTEPVSTEPASTEPVSTEPVAATGTDDETDPPDTPPAPTSGAEETPDAGGEEV